VKSNVSIVIPTWQRFELLVETLENIRQQSYDKIYEVMVVSDGYDDILDDAQIEDQFDIQLVLLGRNWSSKLPNSFGIAPLMVGYLMAGGDYIMPWCDDERALTVEHIEKMVSVLDEDENVKFVYPRVHIWRNGDPNGSETNIIGVCPPVENQITHYMFRASNLWEYGLPDWGTHPLDWSLVKKWMSAFKGNDCCVMIDEVTFSHRLDH
jgi:glycosyltransferase involved in cell wall biosynthesis